MFGNLIAWFNMIMGVGGILFAIFVIVTGILDFQKRKSDKKHCYWVIADLQDDILISVIMGLVSSVIFTCGFLLLRVWDLCP